MSKKMSEITKWEIIEFCFIAVAGTLLHFVYEWTGQNPVAAIFAPVNESTWEHLKLLFMPSLFFTILQEVAIGRKYPSLITDKGKAVLWGMAFITVFFYTYSGILGRNISWIDIGSFYVAAAVYIRIFLRKMKGRERKAGKRDMGVGAAIFALSFLLFVVFTVKAPKLGIFFSPV